MPFEVTTAVRLPFGEGCVVKVTVSDVDVAAITVPEPLEKTTVLLDAVVLNPVPVMTMEVELLPRLAVPKDTVGAATAIPLVRSATATAALAPAAQSSAAAMLYVVASIDKFPFLLRRLLSPV